MLLPVDVSEIVQDEWQTVVSAASDLGLHSLLRPICSNI